MKKSNILIAGFAVVMAAASVVKAEGFGMDFDRGSFRTADFMDAVKASDVSRGNNAGNITPAPAAAGNTLNMRVYKLADHGLQKLRKKVLTIPGLSKEFLQQINEAKTIVLYNENNVFLTTPVGEVQYIILESNDKELLGFLAKQGADVFQEEFRNKNLVYVCITRLETIMKWVNNAWVAYEIAKEICSWQGDDTSSPSNPNSGGIGHIPGGSGIPGIHHNRQGGSFN